jgi:AP2-associated kinase
MQMAGVHSPTPPQQQQHYAPPLPPQQYAAYLSPEQQQLYQQAASHVRPGTLPPGVCVKIGEHEVTIERFLSEGE